MAAEELLFDRLHKADPTLQQAFLKHRHRLNVGGYARVQYILTTEASTHREWRKAFFRLFDAKLLELNVELERLEIDHQLDAMLSPYVYSYCEILEGVLASIDNEGAERLPCINQAKNIESQSTIHALRQWDAIDAFYFGASKILEAMDNTAYHYWPTFIKCMRIADRYDASRAIVACLSSGGRQTISSLPRRDLSNAMSRIKSLIDDNTKYSNDLREILYDLMKDTTTLPSYMVITGVRMTHEASVGGGGMADIFRGRQVWTGKLLALKVPRGVYVRDTEKLEPEDKAKLKNVYMEAMVWWQLKHENILSLIGVVFRIPYDTSIALVTPWMANGYLDVFLKNCDKADRMDIISQIASGLCYLHSQQPEFILGDLRAGNILVDDHHRPLLADFGLSSTRTKKTNVHTGDGIGTVRWQAPETLDAIDNRGHRSTASDIYAFAMTCLEIFTGDVPFPDLQPLAVVRAVADKGRHPERPKSDVVLTRGLDDDFWDLLCKCWSRDPDSRPTIDQICSVLGERLSLPIAILNYGKEEPTTLSLEVDDVEVADSASNESHGSVLSLQVTDRPVSGRPIPPLPIGLIRRPRSAPPFVEGKYSMALPAKPLSAQTAPAHHPIRLPPGWKPVKEEKSGQTLYVNEKLHLITHIRPSEYEHLDTDCHVSKASFFMHSGDTYFVSKAKSFEPQTRLMKEKNTLERTPPPLPPRRSSSVAAAQHRGEDSSSDSAKYLPSPSASSILSDGISTLPGTPGEHMSFFAHLPVSIRSSFEDGKQMMKGKLHFRYINRKLNDWHDLLDLSQTNDFLDIERTLAVLLGQAPMVDLIRTIFSELSVTERADLIDLLHKMLRFSDKLENPRRLDQLLTRLVKETGRIPSLMIIKDVTRNGPNAVAGGGFADVWSGLRGNINVALKVLRIFGEGELNMQILRAFCSEVLVWHRLHHSNIMPFLGVCETEFAPRYALVSPWMKNGHLLQYLRKRPSSDRRALMLGIAKGMEYLHSLHPAVVHGDLRSPNILIDDNGQPRISDFGLARFFVSEGGALTQTTFRGQGSASWQAPELLYPSKFSDIESGPTKSSDVYAFACVCIEIFTEKAPFSGLTDVQVIMEVAVRDSRPPRPPQIAEERGLSDAVWSLIQDCWAVQPAERPIMAAVRARIQDTIAK